MSSPPLAPHVYERDIRSDERTSLSVLASHISVGARVLDLGCGSGAIGRFLAARDGAAAGPIDGLTLSHQEADRASKHYRQVEIADLDNSRLSDLFSPGSYDVIVCADVIEHIRQGGRVLTECRELLAAGGRLLLSIPNVGYSGLIAELIAGEFRYRTEGLLDETHVKFFTRDTLMRFLADQGWVAEHTDSIERELPASEFSIAFDALPPAVARHLLALPDGLTYQFIVVARPQSESEIFSGSDSNNTQRVSLPAQALFTSQLFTGVAGTYGENHKITRLGVIGQERQTLRFDLPERSFSGLRFDPADRPGFMHLHAMRLCSRAGEVLWSWDATKIEDLLGTAHHDCVLQPPATSSGAFLLLLHGNDPWIELPIDSSVLKDTEGGSLEIDMGWPMSADYLALAGTAQRLQKRRDSSERQIEQLQAMCSDLQHKVREVTDQYHGALAENAQLDDRNEQLSQRNQALLISTHSLSSQRDEAMDLVRAIHDSTVFKATRPIVHAKMALDRLLGVGSARKYDAVTVSDPVPLTPPAVEPVDIIVPVYRSLEDTARCLASVLASTPQTPWRLVIINDASPEPKLTLWLREFVAKTNDARILLLENELNLGFVGTVNRGMSLDASHDVLLLNSDTEVAGDWLDRIRDAAYSDQKVASVTPFSNNATICSYPRFCEDNNLPQGWSTAELDALCARTNPGQVVDVPTGVGFCMYIRRAVLDEIGLFDVENFGKGYGEENDFCLRAANAGWRNLHILDTFVRHFGGVSFGDSKSPRERAAMDTMRRLHPNYEAQVIEFVRRDPAAQARAALDFARLTARSLPVILAVTHDREGGTLQHVYQLAKSLASKASMVMLRPAPGGQVSLELAEERSGSQLLFSLPGEFDALIQFLRVIGVRHVHFHHLLGHGSLVRDALVGRLGVTHDFTAHDFYPVCPQLSMIGVDGVYCGEAGVAQCMACLRKHPAPNRVDIQTWRAANEPLLAGARHVLSPSRDALNRLATYSPLVPYRLVPHLEAGYQAVLSPLSPRQLAPGTPLKVVVVGALSAIKGADVLEDVARAARQSGAALEFHLIGYAYRSLQTQPRAALTIHGPYKNEEELNSLLEWLQPDLVWFPALVPETYSYTLSEVIRARLPIVAPDLGSFPERLHSRPWSWIEKWDQSTTDWLEFFNRIASANFAQLTAPTPPNAVAENPGRSDRAVLEYKPEKWYMADYLEGIPASETNRDLQPLKALIKQHLAPFRIATGGASHKSAALRLILRLRASPALAPLARAISPRWQGRIKSWLLR